MVGNMRILLFHPSEYIQNYAIEAALVTYQKGINAL